MGLPTWPSEPYVSQYLWVARVLPAFASGLHAEKVLPLWLYIVILAR